MIITIYIPAGNGASFVAPKSAIVGIPDPGSDRVTCYFEGAIHANPNRVSFFEKLKSAAGRLVQRYPTVATASFKANELLAVGLYDADRFVVVEISDPDALAAWNGEEPGAAAGVYLLAGRTTFAEAAALVHMPSARAVGRQSMARTEAWYKTQAGQLLRFDLVNHSAQVFDHDDPSLPGLLAHLSLGDDEMKLAIGGHATPVGFGP